MIIPSNRGVILRCRNGDIILAGAMAQGNRGYGRAVVGERANWRVRLLSIPARWELGERENIGQRPNMDASIGGAGENEIRRAINDERSHWL